jgi:hypothetical protein
MDNEEGFDGLAANTPAELTAIQDQIDAWVDRGVVITKAISRGAKAAPRLLYRVAHPWELERPPEGERRHVHDWRHDLIRQGTHEGILYCSGCEQEVTRAHEEFADPRVIRHKNDGLGLGNRVEVHDGKD